MKQDLFKEYFVDDLINVTREGLGALRIKARATAVADASRIVESYAYKNPQGKPLYPPDSGPVYNGLVDVIIPSYEPATQLGVEGKKIPVNLLWKLAKAETTLFDRDNSAVQQAALDLLVNGLRDTSRYDAAVAAYPAARGAYILLSAPLAVKPEDHAILEKGAGILNDLKQREGDSFVLLAEREYKALTAGAFEVFDAGVFARDNQTYRRNFNICDSHSHDRPGEHRFVTLYDPEKMAEIEAMMQKDKTAKWLLQHVKEDSTPVLLHEYLSLDTKAVKGWCGGRYSPGTGKEVRDYICLFTFRDLSLLMLAEAYAHEARHKWQRDNMSIEEANADNEIDVIILRMRRESDSQAVGTKVLWSLKNKLKYSDDVIVGAGSIDNIKEFDRAFHHQAYAELNYTAKLKKATQSVFVDFLQREISDAPSYLLRFIDKHLGHSGVARDASVVRAIIERSPFLKPSFLRHRSQYGSGNACYLDDDGIDLVRKKFIEDLPEVIVNYNPPLQTSPKRSRLISEFPLNPD